MMLNIDLTRIGWALKIETITGGILVFVLVGTIIVFLLEGAPASVTWLAVGLGVLATLAWLWVDRKHHRATWLKGAPSAILGLSWSVMACGYLFADAAGEITLGSDIKLILMFMSPFIVVLCLVNARAAIYVATVQIPILDKRLTQLLHDLRKYEHAARSPSPQRSASRDPSKARLYGLLGWLTILMIPIMIGVGIWTAVANGFSEWPIWANILTFFVILVGVTQARSLAERFSNMSRGLAQSNAEDLIISDSRAPVLFLRAFVDDADYLQDDTSRSACHRTEEIIAGRFQSLGPVVAIGQPGEPVPLPGAARSYFSDETWQAAILDWLSKSQLVVYLSARTLGTRWELDQILQSDHWNKLLIVLPAAFEKDIAHHNSFYDAFEPTRWYEAISLLRFNGARVILLGSEGTVTVLRSDRSSVFDLNLALDVARYTLLLSPKNQSGETT